jgi:hypothetical protein
MQCAGQQPNQTGCWLSLPNKRQKHVMMVRPYPTWDTPTTTESFGFYNLITLPNNRQAFVPKTKTKIQPTITIHNPYIYSTKQTSINTNFYKHKNGQNTSECADLMSRSRGVLGIRVLRFFTSQVHFKDFDFFLRLTMK